MESETELGIDSLVEDVLLPEDMSVLRAEMYSQINDAVSLGVFTKSEANQWKDGFEACTESSHMENLIDVIDDFVASGLAVVGKIENLLDNALISESEKNQWRGTTEDASFDEKQDIVEQLKAVIKKIDSLKYDLITTLDKKQIESNKKAALLKKFISSDISSKENIVKKAEQLEADNADSSKKQNPEQDNQTSIIEQNLKIKTKYQKAIANYLAMHRFQTARNILDKGKTYFIFDEYSAISRSIDSQEIITAKKDIRLAA